MRKKIYFNKNNKTKQNLFIIKNIQKENNILLLQYIYINIYIHT